jgi:hypothetical protein
MFSNVKLQQWLWIEAVVLPGNSVTIGCKRHEDSGRGINRSSSNYSNVKLISFDSYGFLSAF